MPGILRKSAAFVLRYEKFESISLQRRVSKNAAERLDTGKLSSGSEEGQNIVVCVKQVTLRRQCKQYIRQS